MVSIPVKTSPALEDTFYYAAGIGFLALAKLKHLLNGYSTPKPIPNSDYGQCVDYDITTVDHWLSHLAQYCPAQSSIKGKKILELGPGADLGIALYLLALGAEQYNALDVHNLVERVSPQFYDQLFERLQRQDGLEFSSSELREALEKATSRAGHRLNYVCREDFDIAASFEPGSLDLVFSQAAFEHFDDVDRMAQQLGEVVKPGGMLIAEVDLMTHSRWIREKDPNNIYRYNDGLYNLFYFKGIPNRVRPNFYRECLLKHGWKEVLLKPLECLSEPQAGRLSQSWSPKFRGAEHQMECLTFMLCATKA
ncbi:MAG: class I SAM-dependent methyltransferase [Synechococcales cyanobacterium RM1_1_8]|nr:class I SAM-dependent methyltransferase [Synechococcales cyanobacterium RM1_1_8]